VLGVVIQKPSSLRSLNPTCVRVARYSSGAVASSQNAVFLNPWHMANITPDDRKGTETPLQSRELSNFPGNAVSYRCMSKRLETAMGGVQNPTNHFLPVAETHFASKDTKRCG